MDHITEHAHQVREGRERLSLRNKGGSTGRRTFENSKAPVKFAKGHDAVLKAAQDSGATCFVQPMNGDAYSGKVLNRDRYTVTLLVDGRKRVVYKHAVEFFEVVEEADVSGSTSH